MGAHQTKRRQGWRDALDMVPLSDALGGEVRGIDLGRGVDDAMFGAIHQAWLDRLVLVFRGQHVTDAALVAFSRRLGALDVAPPNENGRRFVEGFPEILVVSNVVEDGVAIGSLGAGDAAWHTDMSYVAEPPSASVLHALEVPATGGDTGFLNMYMALDALTPELRSRIERATLKHDAAYNSTGYLRQGAAPVTDVTTCPGAIHPLVRTHPESGRKALYLGRRENAYVSGLPVADSESLLDDLWAAATDARFSWHHRWRTGDVVMWDNRCTMHRRDAFDPGARRIMHRTQVKGAKPI